MNISGSTVRNTCLKVPPNMNMMKKAYGEMVTLLVNQDIGHNSWGLMRTMDLLPKYTPIPLYARTYKENHEVGHDMIVQYSRMGDE